MYLWIKFLVQLILNAQTTTWPMYYRMERIQPSCSWTSLSSLTLWDCIMLFNQFALGLSTHYFHTFIMYAVDSAREFYRIYYWMIFETSFFFRFGQPYIYPILDWRKPGIAFTAIGAILFLIIVIQMILYCVYKLRVFTQRRLFVRKEFDLPSTSKQISLPY